MLREGTAVYYAIMSRHAVCAFSLREYVGIIMIIIKRQAGVPEVRKEEDGLWM